MKPAALLALILAVGTGANAVAQTDVVETDPIRCWWRTSVPAVRVGEPFSIVLTCSVVETDAVIVVPNEAELAPNAMQLPPFDVLGGSHGADLRTVDHRFFQYEYRVRLVSDEFFGKDVDLPELKIAYKVRTRVEADALEGRDQSYVLPQASLRVLSLVPDDALDIRDPSVETFDQIDRRLSRANLLRVVGIVLIGFAALAALVSVVRAAGGAGRQKAAPRALVSDSAVLREAGRELARIQRARQDGEWTADLQARLLTITRILGAYALELPVTAVVGEAKTGLAPAGQLTVRTRAFRGATAVVPAWVTPAVIDQELARIEKADAPRRRVALLEALRDVLGKLTTTQYGRDKRIEQDVVDAALSTASSVLRRLKIENMWIGKKLRAASFTRAGLEQRLWSR